MIRTLLSILIVAAACSERKLENMGGDDPTAGKLVGAWDATMTVGQPYALQFRASRVRAICGMIGLIDNRTRNASAEEVASATQLGVYDLPLSQIGLEWNGAAAFPGATVSTTTIPDYSSKAHASDSVQIVLNPGSEERIILRGRYERGGINGTWIAQSARGTANGSFSLRPHFSSESRWRQC